MRQRHVGDGGIHYLHECGNRYRESYSPRVVSGMETLLFLIRHIVPAASIDGDFRFHGDTCPLSLPVPADPS